MLALFLAYVTPEWVETIQDVGVVLGTLTALGVLLVAAGRFLIFSPLRKEIKEATKQIQPTTNGGLSLADVNKKADRAIQIGLESSAKLDVLIDLQKDS